MKILIFNWRDITHPEAGGAEVYIHEIAKRLAKKHEITLFCGAYQGCEPESVIDGIRIIRKGKKYSIYLFAPLVYLQRLRQKCDIIIDCENGIPFFTPLFSRKPEICVMHHVHKKVFSKELPFFLSWIGYSLEVFLMPLAYKNVNFVAVSPSTQREMIELGISANNIRLVYNGINGQYSPDWNKKKKNHIVYVGRIKKYKQLNHLVQAFQIVRNKIQDSELIIAGKGDYTELKELSEKLNIKISLYYEITENEKIDLLQKASVFITSSMMEGWGITVIEANRCGTPVIAYDVPGLRDSIKNNETGLLVQVGNIEELAENIVKVFNTNDFRERLSKNAFEWSKKFSWDRSAEEFEDILEMVMCE